MDQILPSAPDPRPYFRLVSHSKFNNVANQNFSAIRGWNGIFISGLKLRILNLITKQDEWSRLSD